MKSNKSRFNMLRKISFLSIYAIFILLGNVSVQTLEKDSTVENIKIGLALSGGGALGIAHIGVLQAFEEEGIPIDLIAGTSMGSIVGGLYASGYSSSEQRRIVKEIDWVNIFSEKSPVDMELVGSRYGILEPLLRLRFKFWEIYIPPGFSNGQSISNELFYYTSAANFAAGSNFNKLLVPYRAIAVDTLTGEVLVISEGELSQAIRGSMAIPMIFYPTRFNDHLLIDGGVINNLPTDVLRDMGADIVIACDVNGLPTFEEEPKTILAVAQHTMDIAFHELKKDNLKLADVLIVPDLKGHEVYEFSDLETLIDYGYQAAMANMDEIKKLIPPEKIENKILSNQLDTNKLDQALINTILVRGLSNVRKNVVISKFPLKENNTYNTDLAISGIEEIYATGLFENIWLELERIENDNVNIIIHVVEKYPRTLGFGLNYNELEGLSGFFQIIHFNLFGWGERFMPYLRYGDLYRKTGIEIVNDRLFSTPITLNNGIYYEQEMPSLYNDEGLQVDELKIDRIAGQFSIGAHVYKKLLFMAGLIGERIWLEENTYLGLSSEAVNVWNVFGKIFFNNTDNTYFPHRGINLSLEAETFGNIDFSENASIKMEGDLSFHFPISKNQTISANFFVGTSINGLPVYEKFRVGGPGNLPGYFRNELWGEHAYIIGLNYRLKLFKIIYFDSHFSATSINDSYLFKNNFYKGISTGLMADSPIGPISIIYGWNETGRDQLYFSMGYSF